MVFDTGFVAAYMDQLGAIAVEQYDSFFDLLSF
jgi:hypothetical protein